MELQDMSLDQVFEKYEVEFKAIAEKKGPQIMDILTPKGFMLS